MPSLFITNQFTFYMQKNLQILSSRTQELQMLKMSSLSRLLKTRAANIKADAVSRHLFSIDSENKDEV